MADTMTPEQAKAVLERHRALREELKPREVILAGGKEYRETLCELWDALESALDQHKALTLPQHQCEPIAVAQLNDVGGRGHWVGRLLNPIPGYEEETHCMHYVTPLKGEVVFGCIMADFEQLAALCQAARGEPINPHWLDLRAREYVYNAGREDVRASIDAGEGGDDA